LWFGRGVGTVVNRVRRSKRTLRRAAMRFSHSENGSDGGETPPVASLLRLNYFPVPSEKLPCSAKNSNSQAGVSLISNSFRENAWRRAIFRDVGWGNMSQRLDDSPARDSRPGHRAAARD